jgi:hypothetical protein
MYLPPNMYQQMIKEQHEERVRMLIDLPDTKYYEGPRLSLNGLKRLFARTARDMQETMIATLNPEPSVQRNHRTTQEVHAVK